MDGGVGRSLSFITITENLYLSDNQKSRDSYVYECHCTNACGEQCINFLMDIECGNECPWGDHCRNRRFQRKEYKKLDVFWAGKKGQGIRAAEYIKARSFIIEYVGEVLSGEAMLARLNRYNCNGVKHRYMMSLNNGDIIDATVKGNLSRLINHSCDPNCVVEKWMVLGRTRVGIFARRNIEVGEELSFDYQFDVHEMSMQACYCGASNCRGVLAVRALNTHELPVSPQQKAFGRLSTEEEQSLVALVNQGSLKTFSDALQCANLMRRTEDLEQRLQLADLIMNSRDQVRRDFLNANSCAILGRWMTDVIKRYDRPDEYILRMLGLLNCLPFPHKTMLEKSCLLEELRKWTNVDFLKQLLIRRKTEERSGSDQEGEQNGLLAFEDVDLIVKKADDLLHSWLLLKEDYKIPRLRIEKEKPNSLCKRAARGCRRVTSDDAAHLSSDGEQAEEQHHYELLSGNRTVENSIPDFSVLKRPCVSSPGGSLSPSSRWASSRDDVWGRESAQDDTCGESEARSPPTKRSRIGTSSDVSVNKCDRMVDERSPKAPASLASSDVAQFRGSCGEGSQLAKPGGMGNLPVLPTLKCAKGQMQLDPVQCGLAVRAEGHGDLPLPAACPSLSRLHDAKVDSFCYLDHASFLCVLPHENLFCEVELQSDWRYQTHLCSLEVADLFEDCLLDDKRTKLSILISIFNFLKLEQRALVGSRNELLEIREKSRMRSPVQQPCCRIPILPIYDAPRGSPIFSPTESSTCFSIAPHSDESHVKRQGEATALRADFKKEMASMVISKVQDYAKSKHASRLPRSQFKRFVRYLTKKIFDKYFGFVLSFGDKKIFAEVRKEASAFIANALRNGFYENFNRSIQSIPT